MIQPLRTLHRRAVLVLAPLLPAIFVAGLASRHIPVAANAALAGEPERTWKDAASFSAGSIRRSADGAWIRIEPSTPAPDLLVYWTARHPSGTTLPDDARLLGTAAATVHLPEPARTTGTIVAYSLPHQAVAGSIPLEDLP